MVRAGKIPTVRAVVVCGCSREISFYIAIEAVKFLVAHGAAHDMPISTERCRNCRQVLPVRLLAVASLARIFPPAA